MSLSRKANTSGLGTTRSGAGLFFLPDAAHCTGWRTTERPIDDGGGHVRIFDDVEAKEAGGGVYGFEGHWRSRSFEWDVGSVSVSLVSQTIRAAGITCSWSK